jgi:hypothetical protein
MSFIVAFRYGCRYAGRSGTVHTNDYEKAGFWAGLNRLYEATVKLAEIFQAHAETAKAHENRLDKIEVVQEWLARRERGREKREGL